ncbi:MAG TPA: hypothetical protein VNX66_09730 [Candidatus Sulfotelmatobacter sp.]|nr:hypothetical protein [Candidatus Sulfotelmatobacter sp.]
MLTVQVQKARRDSSLFDGLINRSEENGIFREVKNDAATGQTGNNFLVAFPILSESGRKAATGEEKGH